jgi:hypothetical protein
MWVKRQQAKVTGIIAESGLGKAQQKRCVPGQYEAGNTDFTGKALCLLQWFKRY